MTRVMSRPTRQLTFEGVATSVNCERELAALAVALGARQVAGWSKAEERLAVAGLARTSRKLVADFRERIRAGEDPLGEEFCRLRSPELRRQSGATFTPQPIVDSMLDWAVAKGSPARVVDPGTGSGRFLLAAARSFPAAKLVGVELDPLAALLARANLSACGLAHRAEIVWGDYRSTSLEPCAGATLFIGNPPYVRHHDIGARWKNWLSVEAKRRDLSASQLAGLHVHFFLATVVKARPGDFGAYITAAEWLDVNYGSLPRGLFLGDLGGERILVIEPTAMPFPDAATTAAITYFQIGTRAASARLRRVGSLSELSSSHGDLVVPRERLAAAPRWSPLTRAASKRPAGLIELGELCRVHRGQVNTVRPDVCSV